MRNLEHAAYELQRLDTLAKRDGWPYNRHPLSKLLVTLLFIVLVVSLPKYELSGLLLMAVYLIVLFVIGELSWRDCLRRIWIVLPLVYFIGIWNPLFDRSPVQQIGSVIITGGMISMLTLVIKGVYAVLASYLLIATTSMDGICYALQCLHVPEVLIIQLQLTFRYISLFLQEVHRMSQAYALRAPGQRGIQFRMWGTFVGQLLLRSVDRSETVYQSMCLRGYTGRYTDREGTVWTGKDWLYVLVWGCVLIVLRMRPMMGLFV